MSPVPLPVLVSPVPRRRPPRRRDRRVFLQKVAAVGRPAGLRPGPLATFMCDALCFQETPWLGYLGTSGGELGAIDAATWQKHRDVFRAVFGSCISTTR